MFTTNIRNNIKQATPQKREVRTYTPEPEYIDRRNSYGMESPRQQYERESPRQQYYEVSLILFLNR